MATVAQCLEELKEYPKTPEEAIFKYRGFINKPDFQQAPSEKIKQGVIEDTEVSYFGFWYSKKYKKYFLFTNAPGHYSYLGAPFCLMKICVICVDTLIFLGTQNIIVDGPIYSSPRSPWYRFRDVIYEMGTDLDTAWESFYRSAFIEDL